MIVYGAERRAPTCCRGTSTRGCTCAQWGALSGGSPLTFRHQLLKILKAQRGTLCTAPYHGYYDSLRCQAASPHVLQRYVNQGGTLVHRGALKTPPLFFFFFFSPQPTNFLSTICAPRGAGTQLWATRSLPFNRPGAPCSRRRWGGAPRRHRSRLPPLPRRRPLSTRRLRRPPPAPQRVAAAP